MTYLAYLPNEILEVIVLYSANGYNLTILDFNDGDFRFQHETFCLSGEPKASAEALESLVYRQQIMNFVMSIFRCRWLAGTVQHVKMNAHTSKRWYGHWAYPGEVPTTDIVSLTQAMRNSRLTETDIILAMLAMRSIGFTAPVGYWASKHIMTITRESWASILLLLLPNLRSIEGVVFIGGPMFNGVSLLSHAASLKSPLSFASLQTIRLNHPGSDMLLNLWCFLRFPCL